MREPNLRTEGGRVLAAGKGNVTSPFAAQVSRVDRLLHHPRNTLGVLGVLVGVVGIAPRPPRAVTPGQAQSQEDESKEEKSGHGALLLAVHPPVK